MIYPDLVYRNHFVLDNNGFLVGGLVIYQVESETNEDNPFRFRNELENKLKNNSSTPPIYILENAVNAHCEPEKGLLETETLEIKDYPNIVLLKGENYVMEMENIGRSILGLKNVKAIFKYHDNQVISLLQAIQLRNGVLEPISLFISVAARTEYYSSTCDTCKMGLEKLVLSLKSLNGVMFCHDKESNLITLSNGAVIKFGENYPFIKSSGIQTEFSIMDNINEHFSPLVNQAQISHLAFSYPDGGKVVLEVIDNNVLMF